MIAEIDNWKHTNARSRKNWFDLGVAVQFAEDGLRL